jgi:polysaccharide pyruvyl transferase WcaK-like protein
MFKTNILFNGYYGKLNAGDDAFVEVASWMAKKYWSKSNIRFLAKKQSLPLTKIPVKGYPLSLPKTYATQEKLLIKNTDYFISAGGSTFHSELKLHYPEMIALKNNQTSKSKIKLGAIGISLGPFKNIKAEKNITNYVKNLDFLTVRDKMSYDIANSMQLPYKPIESFDLAALLPEIYHYQNVKTNNKTIGISVCNYERYVNGDLKNEARRNEKLIQLIKQLNAFEKLNFKFFIINGNPVNGDRELTLRVIHSCNLKDNYEIIDYSRRTQTLWESIAACNVMISTRLHGAIFACFAKTPFILIEYHRKCSDFLNDISYDGEMRIGDAHFDTQKLSSKILDIVNEPALYNSPGKADLMIEKARLNFTTINL